MCQPGDRAARFECAVVVIDPENAEDILHAVGTVEGNIIFEPRGENGFGYDPIFVPLGETRTTAEMSADEKDALSHRGRAIQAIVSTVERPVAQSSGPKQRGFPLRLESQAQNPSNSQRIFESVRT